ncbi:MAG: hypothetical protein ABIR18_04130 [Chitinophagaceae bacterium]
MIINRHNYEEFFILYLDNELSREDRSRVELFAQQHPDLQEELVMLQQSRLEVDTTIVFEGKESLMKTTAQGFITPVNYQEWLVLYIDNELTAEQRTAVESYAAANPSVKKELELFQQTKLQPAENIFFLNKESLYREEETTRRVIGMRWWQVAAAVLLLLGMTIGGVLIYSNKTVPGTLVGTNIKTPKNNSLTPVIKSAQEDKQVNTDIATINPDQPVSREVKEQDVAVKTPVIKKENIAKSIKKEKEDEPVLARVEKNKNNLPERTRNPNMNGSTEKNDAMAVKNPALTNKKQINSGSLVTSVAPQPFIQTKNTLPSDEDVVMNESEKKTKFRGLLRKITRTFEKATNIKATDEDDRLLVAGLAIRL